MKKMNDTYRGDAKKAQTSSLTQYEIEQILSTSLYAVSTENFSVEISGPTDSKM